MPAPLLLQVTTVEESLVFFRGQTAYLKSAGFRVCAVCSPGEFVSKSYSEEFDQVHWVRMNRSISLAADLLSLVTLWRLFRRLRPDLVHSHTPKAGLLGTIAARLAGVKVVFLSVNGLPQMGQGKGASAILNVLYRISCSLAHHVRCDSPSILQYLVDHRLCPRSKAFVLGFGSPNGVDTVERFNPARFGTAVRQRIRASAGIPSGSLVLGYVGRLARDKGVREMVEAWAEIRREYPHLHFLLVGPPDRRDPVEEVDLELLRSDSRVHLVGYQEDVAPYFAAMDIFIMPSHREGFGVTNIEAASMSLPVVSTAIPGCVDSVLDGTTGLLVPARNPAILAEAIRRYVDDPRLRNAHGKAGRNRVCEEFSQDRVWKALHSRYISAVEQRGRPNDSQGLVGKLVRAGYWSLLGAVLSRGLTFVAAVVLARMLDIRGFGEFSIIQSTLSFLGVFSIAGFAVTATKYVAQHRSIDQPGTSQYITIALLLAVCSGVFVTTATLLLAPVIAVQAIGQEQLTGCLMIAAPMTLFSAVTAVQAGILTGLEEFRAVAMVNLARSIAQLCLLLLGAVIWGLPGALGGMTAGEAVCMGVAGMVLKGAHAKIRPTETTRGIDWIKLRRFVAFSFPAFLASIVTQPAIWFSNLVLVRLSDGTSSLAVFNAADRYRQMLLFLPVSLAPIALAMLSNLHGSGTRREYGLVFRISLFVTLGSVMVPSILIMAFSSWCMGLFGDSYQGGNWTLIILSASSIFVSLNTVLGQTLVSTGHMWWRFAMDALLSAVLVLFALYLVPVYRDLGLAGANLAAFGITVVGLFLIQQKVSRDQTAEEYPGVVGPVVKEI
jgi:glycosyltransferase involved in cell wall biosynthesis/O-antigen/teichoic acid export membrane protein